MRSVLLSVPLILIAALLAAGQVAADPLATVSKAASAASPEPSSIRPILQVGPADTMLDPVTGRLTVAPSALPPPAAGLPVINPALRSPVAQLLSHLVATGQASGLAGILYDNRDRGHSRLPPQLFPELTRIVYGPAFRAQGLDFGLAGAFRFPAITFGNSSTAVTSGPIPRSLARLEMTVPGNAWRAWDDYSSNALYIYPAHYDFPENHREGAADSYPAAWPYTLTSKGSSGSDQPFLHEIAMILAALRPDTRTALQKAGLVAPTLQMVFRRSQTGVRSRADYLSGRAHPSAFARGAVNPEGAIDLANSLTPSTIPPLVRLSVESEDFAAHAGLLGRSEKLFDTPSAIARLWRGPAWQHQMVVSAAQTVDPNNRSLTFRWVLLRGDPARVRIEPLDAQDSSARITIDWQTPRPAPAGFTVKGPGPMSDRVDIGVFADNGAHLSAPAFISVDFPGQQIRHYAPGPDGRMRLAETDYDANGRQMRYDPLLWFSAPWRDRDHYDAAGHLTGWTRISTRPGPRAAQSFTANGKPADGPPIRYLLKRPGADLAAQEQKD